MSMNSNGFGTGGRNRYRMLEMAKNEHFDLDIVRRVITAFRPYWPQAALLSLLLLIISVGNVIPAWLTQRIIDNGILKENASLVIDLTLLLLAIAVLTGLLGVWQNWLSNSIAQNVMSDYRLALFRNIQSQSMNFFTTQQAGDLVSRVMNDVTAIQTVVTSTLVGVVNNLLLIIATLSLMFSMNWQLTILALIVVPGFVLPTQRVGSIRQQLQSEIQQKMSVLTVQLSENFGVSGALLIRIFNREPEESKRFAEMSEELRDLQIRQTLIGRWFFMLMNMFSALGPALLWGYGGWLVIHHQIGIGVIVSFTTLLAKLYGPLSQLAQLHVNVYSSIALFRRIFSLLDAEPEIKDGPVAIPTDRVCGQISLEGVSYAYPCLSSEGDNTVPVLKKIDLLVQPHMMVALVGPSGAGKTTLINLIPRFADPTAGRVLLDDQDIRNLTLSSLRAQLGIVPQDPFFFHDTIYNNLIFANPEATMRELEGACQAAQIHDLIQGLPEGYQTLVGERGYRLSGGERQRLAIARVLLRSPSIVLLDEATSALDSLVERQIQQALEILLKDRTSIVIAHRLSTILKADLIVVLENGQVVATGNHKTLLDTCTLYKKLYELQFAPVKSSEPFKDNQCKDGGK
ncbi:MAG: ABC transporter ATP-binding protein [Desulfitobacteriaceae bacterium]